MIPCCVGRHHRRSDNERKGVGPLRSFEALGKRNDGDWCQAAELTRGVGTGVISLGEFSSAPRLHLVLFCFLLLRLGLLRRA